MNNTNNGLEQSALVMRLIGWGLIVSLALAAFVYSPGFLWGSLPPGSHSAVQRILRRLTMHCTHTY